MIRAGAGLSSRQDTESAAREAAEAALDRAGTDAADWGLVFATTDHRPALGDLVRTVSDELETVRLVGCTGNGVLTDQGEIEGSPGVAVLAVSSDTLRAEPLLYRAGRDGGGTAAVEMSRGLAGSLSDSDVLVVLPDPYHIRAERLIRTLSSVIGPVPIVGALPSDDGSLGATYQFCGRQVESASIAGVHLSGEFSHLVEVTQGCLPVGDPCIVTRVQGSLVLELDGRPALQVLSEQIPRPLLERPSRLATSLFVALPPDPADRELVRDEYLVRSIVSFDVERGAFEIAGELVENQMLSLVLREGDSAREDLKRMLERAGARSTGEPPAFGLYFNCAARGRSLYGMPGIDTAYLASALPGTPVAGFFGNAELAPLRGVNRLFTYTGVLALFGD